MKFATKLKQGFTLVELLVSIAIIGLIASTVLASLSNSRAGARDAQRVQEARQLVSALELYRNENGRYPCSGGTLLCAAGSVGGATQAVIKNSTGSYTAFENSIRTALRFNPNRDAINATALVYRVRSAAGNNDSTDPTSYTVVVYQERANTYCEINVGPGHSGYAYNTCNISGI